MRNIAFVPFFAAWCLSAQTPAKFEVASIKPCRSRDTGGKNSGGRGGGGGIRTSPGRLNATCMSVVEMMKHAYFLAQDNPPIHASIFDPDVIRGGPSWAYSDSYSIQAETSDPAAAGGGSASMRLMMGPMLQALLTDRFQLQVHRETEEIPVYALTVARAGFKLKPMEPGACVPPSLTPGAGRAAPANGKPPCVNHVGSEGGNWTMDAAGTTMERFARALGDMILGRPVIDKTGIAGEFLFHLVFARDQTAPGALPLDAPGPDASDPSGPSVFTELEQKLGLKLAPDKGPRGYVVIDRIERPGGN